MSLAGGCTFAERADVAAPDARLLWRADVDPGTLEIVAEPGSGLACDDIDPAVLAPWLSIIDGAGGVQHVVLSDGWHHLRLDVAGAPIMTGIPIMLRYAIAGRASAERKAASLQQFLYLVRHRRFMRPRVARDPVVLRGILALRVADAMRAGANQREIAEVLFGTEMLGRGWDGPSDFLRSRVRRLVRDARRLAAGGFRSLMKERLR